MSKKIFGLLLVICLVVGLLPVVASAEVAPKDAPIKFGFTTLSLTDFDTPVYTINYSKETQDTAGNKFTKWGQTTTGADESNYNAKYEWKTGDPGPTLTLRGFKMDEWNNETEKMEAKYDSAAESYTESGMQTYSITTDKDVPTTIILTGEDSLIECKFGITFYNDLTIKSEGTTKLTMFNQSSCIAPNNSTGNLTINANLDLSLGSFYDTKYAAAVIHTYGGNLTIDGGTINCKIRQDKAASPVGISARNGGNLTINGGTITAMSIVGAGATNGCITSTGGKLTINGGTVNANPKRAVGLYGKTGVEINGGIVNVMSPYYGVNAGTKDAPADIAINGGNLKVLAQYSFYKAPVVNSKIFAFAGASEKSAEVYDGSDPNLCKKPWWFSTDDEKQKIEIEEEEEEIPIFTVPSTPVDSTPATTPSTPADSTPATTPSTPTGSTPAATTPVGGETQAPTGSQNETKSPTDANTDKTDGDTDEGSSNLILWIVVGVIVAGAAAAVIIIVLKRKKA